jgi:hypothetical protein
MYEAGKINVKGVDYNVFTEDNGDWVTHIPGSHEKVTSTTKGGLADAIRRATRKAQLRVEVPFTQLETSDDAKVRHGVATGIHAGTRNVLVTWDDGAKVQITGYSGTTVPRLSNEETAQYEDILRRYREAGRQKYAFEQAHKWPGSKYGSGLASAVRDAAERALAGEEAASE